MNYLCRNICYTVNVTTHENLERRYAMQKEKLVKILLIVFAMVFSFTVLTHLIPESKYIQETIGHLEDSQNTIMKFSGTTIATSLSLSALPNDFASPLASTVSDLNTYFIFIFAVLGMASVITVAVVFSAVNV